MNKKIHIFEGKHLFHGPVWLSYLVETCLPLSKELAVTFPDMEDYSEFKAKWSNHKKVVLRPLNFPLEEPRYQNALKLGLEYEADLTVITFLDVFAANENKGLLKEIKGQLVGFWFLGPNRKMSVFKCLFSRKERKAYQIVKQLRSLPGKLRQVFLVDESIQPRIASRPDLDVTVLPDPWPSQRIVADKGQVREKYGLPLDKKIFFHFGSTDYRKGIDDVIAAWQTERLPADAFLLRAGRTRSRLVGPLSDLPSAMLINRYVSNQELDELLVAADWVLLPYREHAGSSGSLAGAASAGRPVICSNYGILGDRVRNHGLGLTFEHMNLDSFVDCLNNACRADSQSFHDALQEFSANNSLCRFQEILRSELTNRLLEVSR